MLLRPQNGLQRGTSRAAVCRVSGAGKPGRAAAQVHHQPGVQRAVLQLCTYGVVGEQCGFQRDARVLLPELLQHIPQHGQVAGHQRHTDAQPQGGGPYILIRLRAHPVKLLHHRRGLCPEALALFGQGKVIAHIDEQRAAELVFQRGNAEAQRLPGQIHPPGRAGIVQIFAQRQKIAQLLDGHGVLLFTKRKFYLMLIGILYLLFLCL